MHLFLRASLAVGASLIGGVGLVLFLRPEMRPPPGELAEVARSFVDSGTWIVILVVAGGAGAFWMWETVRGTKPEKT